MQEDSAPKQRSVYINKYEFRRLLAARLRDPKTKPKEFIALAELYYGPKIRTARKVRPAKADVDALVRQMESEAKNG